MSVTTRTTAHQKQQKAEEPAVLPRQNTKAQKGTPKGAIPQQTVKSLREATVTRQQSNQASPEATNKHAERASRRTSRSTLRSNQPNAAPVANDGSSSRKERLTRQESQAIAAQPAEIPAMFVIEK